MATLFADRVPGRLGVGVVAKVPLVVAAIGIVSTLFALQGEFLPTDIAYFGTLYDPTYHAKLVFLAANWDFFTVNVILLVVFGTLLTLLTGNLHVVTVTVLSYLLTQLLMVCVVCSGYGMSVVAFSVVAAGIVRAIGYVMRDLSAEAFEYVFALLALPTFLAVFYGIVGGMGTSLVGSAAGFMFGGAIEALFVADDYGSDDTERGIPDRSIGLT